MEANIKIKEVVPIWHKYALTVKEACEYYGIGEKKLRCLVEEYQDSGFVLHVGTKAMIKRQLFEEFLNQTSSI